MDLLLLILVVFLGIIAGIFTGLIPGVHINLVAMFLLVNISFFYIFFDNFYLIIFIIVMGVVHSFVDFIPSVLFSVPDPDTALSILPTHRLVIEGKAYQAIFLSSIGSLFGMFFAIIITPIFFIFLNNFYSFLNKYIWILLLFTIVFLVYLENNNSKRFWAIIIILFSSSLGLLVLNSDILFSPLLVIFTGLFGISSIYFSLISKQNNFPKQDFKIDFKFNLDFFKSILVGGISSTITSISPGLGNAQAGTLSAVLFKNLNSKQFIIVLSSINTINFILSFLTFYLIGKTRNGSVFVISQISNLIQIKDLILYFTIIFFVSIIAFFITLLLGKRLIKIISKINFKIINLLILFLLIFIVFYISGFFGLLVMLASAVLGILCVTLNIKRVHLMSILLVPVILNII